MEPEAAAPLVTEAVAELIALAAAMASNNQDAFQRHNYRMEKMGIPREDRIQAVNIALQVKMGPHRSLVEMAEAYLMGEGSCCSGSGCEGECDCSGEEGACCGGEEGCGCACGD